MGHRRSLLLVTTLLAAALVTGPDVQAAPSEAPAPVPSPSLSQDLQAAITGGKGVCGTSLTADGSSALYVVSLPGSAHAPNRSGLYRRSFVTGEEALVATPATSPRLACGVASADGQRYAFISCPDGGIHCGQTALSIVDTATGTTHTVAATQPTDPGSSPWLLYQDLRISDDHRYVFFISRHGAVVGQPGATPAVLYRYDTVTGAIIRATPGIGGTAPNADIASDYSISANGQVVAFSTFATNIADGVGGVFARSLATGDQLRIAPGPGYSLTGANPQVIGDGTAVFYEQLVDDGRTPGSKDIIGVNLVTGVRHVLSGAAAGGLADGSSSIEAVSADGAAVVFRSTARNLTTGITYPPPPGDLPPISPFNEHLFVRDTATGVTTLVTKADGAAAPADHGAGQATIDAGGDTIVYASDATDLIADYGGGDPVQVYAFERQGSTNRLLTPDPSDPDRGAARSSTEPRISATGRRVLFDREDPFITLMPWSMRLATPDLGPELGGIAGADRYDTAARLSNHRYSHHVPVVFIATGEAFPDALATAPVAAVAGGPVLLTRRDALPQATKDELRRLRPTNIIVVGGTAAVSDAVLNELQGYASAFTDRVAGPDRFATATALAARGFPGGAGTVHIATGRAFPDALSAAAVAGSLPGPILLVEPGSIPPVVAAALEALDPDTIVVLGGTAAISQPVAEALTAYAPDVGRRAGPDRYSTSAAVSANAFAPGVAVAYLATGEAFPDALAAGAPAALVPAPVLLMRRDCVPGAVHDELIRLDPTTIIVLGGPAAITPGAIFQRCP